MVFLLLKQEQSKTMDVGKDVQTYESICTADETAHGLSHSEEQFLPVSEIMPSEPGILLPEILIYIDNRIRRVFFRTFPIMTGKNKDSIWQIQTIAGKLIAMNSTPSQQHGEVVHSK